MSKYFNLLFDKKLDEAEELRKSSIPLKLIKFFSLSDSTRCADRKLNESKFADLAEERLWFSKSENMNDPYEYQCMYINREKFLENGHSEEEIACYDNILNEQKKIWAFTSLSENSFDCLPMWAYYTNNYQGYCIEYDVVKPDAIYKVSYEPEKIPIASLIANMFYAFHEMKAKNQTTSEDMDFYATILKQQFFLKHQSWQHENEYRILYPVISSVGKSISLMKVGLKTSKIVAGLNCSERHKKRLSEISNSIGCGNVLSCKLNDTKYTLLEDALNG